MLGIVLHLGSRCLYILSLFAGLKASWFLFVYLFWVLFVLKFIYLYMYGSFVCMDVVCHVSVVPAEARLLYPLNLELQALVNLHVDAGNQTGSLKENQVLLTAK